MSWDISDKLTDMIRAFNNRCDGMPTEAYANETTIKNLIEVSTIEYGEKPNLPFSDDIHVLYMGVRIMQEDAVPDDEFILV